MSALSVNSADRVYLLVAHKCGFSGLGKGHRRCVQLPQSSLVGMRVRCKTEEFSETG